MQSNNALQVFDAEKMSSSRHAYHKKCFTCRECERMMDAFIACDTPDGERERFSGNSNALCVDKITRIMVQGGKPKWDYIYQNSWSK